MRASPLAVAVAVLAVLTGCPTTVDEGAPDRTVTPAPVPTSAVQYPPGVTDRGISARDLATAHERALERTNYTLVVHQRIVDPNGTIQRTSGTQHTLAGGGTYVGRYERPVSEPPLRRPRGTVEYWNGDEGFAVRQREEGDIAYLSWSDSGEPLVDVDRSRALNQTVRALRFTVTTSTNGSVTLTATGIHDRELLLAPAYVHSLRNVSGSLRVRSDGLVTDWRLAYDATLGDRQVRVIRETHVREIGSTTVGRPAWVNEARNRSE